MKAAEDKLQSAIVSYLKMKYDVLYCASLGGQYQKYKSQRLKAKRTGYVAGFPDLFIYEARNGFNGLAIELKVKGKSPYKKDGTLKKVYAKGGKRHNQIIWRVKLNNRGYLAKICIGFDDAKETIDNYFKED